MLAPRTSVVMVLVLLAILLPATAFAQTAHISVDLALTSGPPIAGTNLTFALTAESEGPDDASNVSLTFAVPTSSTFVSLVTPPGWVCAPPLPPGGMGSTTCTKPTFVPGSEVFTLTVATLPSAPSGTLVKLNASITSTTNDPNQNDNVNEIDVLLIRQSTLAITKTGPASAVAGTVITYTLAVNNTGPSFASDPTVDDTVAAPLRFVSITAAGWSCVTPAVGSPGLVSCTISDLPLGVTNLTLQLDTAPSTAPSTVTNSVEVSAPTDPGGLRTSSAMTQITTSADLTIAKVLAPTPPVAGQSLTYTITVTQNGPSDAANVTVTDPLPGAVRFQSISAPGWSCTTPAVGATGTVSCTRTPLAPGSYVITIQGSVPALTPSGTAVDNTASVTSTTPDPTTPNTASANAALATRADLTIGKSAAPPTPVAGQTVVTHTITVTQNGPSDAVSVVVTDPLPGSLLFQSVNAPGWTCVTPAVGSSGTITCSRAPLPTGVYTVIVQAKVAASTSDGAIVTNTASVTSSTPDPTTPNTASASVTVSRLADLSVTITDSPDPVGSGQDVTYQVVVANGGPSDAAGPSLSVVLDPAAHFSSVAPPPGWTCTTPAVGASGAITCTVASLASGGAATFTIVASTGSAAPGSAATSITTSATVTSSTTDPNPANNSASAITTVVAAIPTLSNLAFVVLAALLAFVAVWKLRALRTPGG